MPLAELEAGFRSDLGQRLLSPARERAFLPALTAQHTRPVSADEPEPRSAAGWAERGMRHLAAGDKERAASSLSRARRAASGEEPQVIFLEGALALEQNRPDEARARLELLERRGLGSYDVELRL